MSILFTKFKSLSRKTIVILIVSILLFLGFVLLYNINVVFKFAESKQEREAIKSEFDQNIAEIKFEEKEKENYNKLSSAAGSVINKIDISKDEVSTEYIVRENSNDVSSEGDIYSFFDSVG